VFPYEHLCDNWIVGPYGRQGQPTRPVHIDQLPPGARRFALQVRFHDLAFIDTPHIQPFEMMECFAYGGYGAWLAADGKTVRVIPGHEEDYADDYERLRAQPDLECEPPGSPASSE
jgi:hypothetical protein